MFLHLVLSFGEDTSSLAPGIYVLQYKDDAGNVVRQSKIIIK